MRSIFSRPLAFSLRTLFVLIGLVCAWLAWERHVVAQRRVLRAELNERAFANPADDCGRYTPKLSRIRLLLGDEGIERVTFLVDCEESFYQRTSRIFPEAEIVRFDRDQGSRIRQ